MGKIGAAVILGFMLFPACAILADTSGEIVFVAPAGGGPGFPFHICTMDSHGTNVELQDIIAIT